MLPTVSASSASIPPTRQHVHLKCASQPVRSRRGAVSWVLPLPPCWAVFTQLRGRIDAGALTAHRPVKLLHRSAAVDVGANVVTIESPHALPRRAPDLAVGRTRHRPEARGGAVHFALPIPRARPRAADRLSPPILHARRLCGNCAASDKQSQRQRHRRFHHRCLSPRLPSSANRSTQHVYRLCARRRAGGCRRDRDRVIDVAPEIVLRLESVGNISTLWRPSRHDETLKSAAGHPRSHFGTWHGRVGTRWPALVEPDGMHHPDARTPLKSSAKVNGFKLFAISPGCG